MTQMPVTQDHTVLEVTAVVWGVVIVIRSDWTLRCVTTIMGNSQFLIIKPTRCINFSNLFLEWNFVRQFLCPSSGVFRCTHSNDICHTGLLTACEQDQDGTQFHPDPAHKLSANLYDIYHGCVYREKLLMMDRGTVRNMQSLISRINLRN